MQAIPSAEIKIRLLSWDSCGDALGEYEGYPVLVPGGIPGEEVLARLAGRSCERMLADILEIINPSIKRIKPLCPYFGQCSGCQWQHLGYPEQLEMKRESVIDALKHECLDPDLVAPVLPAAETLGYRNHARFTVRRGILGFVNRHNHRFIRIDRCLLMNDRINQLLDSLQEGCTGTRQVSIRGGLSGDYLIQPPLTGDLASIESGQKIYHELLSGHRFSVSAASFFQVNSAQAEMMVNLIRDRLGLTGQELLVDAFAGVGTFAVLLAPYARRVIAIEESAAAVKDARENIAGLENVELVQAKTEATLEDLPETPDAVILDPPRAGCQPPVLRALNRRPPKRLAYVSCDPGTLARDTRVLDHGPFTIEGVNPIDLFPQTHHVECVTSLVYNADKEQAFQQRQQIILASVSPRRRQILTEMGIDFQAMASNAEEASIPTAAPLVTVMARAAAKAQSAARKLSAGTVIAADTIVVMGNIILGKPVGEAQAAEYLRELRAKRHRVITAVYAIDAATGEQVCAHRVSQVQMRDYTDTEIAAYIASGQAADKAGAYGIQDTSFNPVASVKGCYLNVVGLPVCALLEVLNRLAVYPQINPEWKPPGNCKDCADRR